MSTTSRGPARPGVISAPQRGRGGSAATPGRLSADTRGSLDSPEWTTPSRSRTWSNATRPGSRRCRDLARDQARRAVRAARPQRGRQVDADPLRHRPRADHLGEDRGLRPRRARRLRAGAPGGRPGPAGGQPRLVPDGRGDARLPRRLLRDAEARAARADQGAARDLLADREARRTHQDPLRRDETAVDPGPGDDAPAAPADPRRADRRRRRRAAARALALRPAHQPGRDDDPAHDPLHRGGGAALRPDRLHQRGQDRRRRDERGAGQTSTTSTTSRTPTWRWSGARSSRARGSRSEA